MANFYLFKALWKMAGWRECIPLDPPLFIPSLANFTLGSHVACFENHTVVVAA